MKLGRAGALVSVLAAVVVAAACSSTDWSDRASTPSSTRPAVVARPKPKPRPRPTTTTVSDSDNRTIALAAQLTLSDLAGYEALSPAEALKDPSDDSATGSCMHVSLVALTGTPAGRVGGTFGSVTSGAIVGNNIEMYASEVVARNAFALAQRPDFIECNRETLIASPDVGQVRSTVVQQRVTFTVAGADATVAMRFAVSNFASTGETAVFDSFLVRHGRAIVRYIAAEPYEGFSVTQSERYVETVIARLQHQGV